jgi:hypothetical protein
MTPNFSVDVSENFIGTGMKEERFMSLCQSVDVGGGVGEDSKEMLIC